MGKYHTYYYYFEKRLLLVNLTQDRRNQEQLPLHKAKPCSLKALECCTPPPPTPIVKPSTAL